MGLFFVGEMWRLTAPGFKKPVILICDVGAVADLRDTQNIMKKPSRADSLLVGDDVAHLMSEHAGKFIIALRERNHFARYVYSSAHQAESVGLWKLDYGKAKTK